jgi:hypothetical protein
VPSLSSFFSVDCRVLFIVSSIEERHQEDVESMQVDYILFIRSPIVNYLSWQRWHTVVAI